MIHLKSLEETKAFAKAFMDQVKPGTVIALEGDLGAGKTTFVKYCAEALGIKETVDSPTFTLLKTYHHPLMHHIDAYRLEGGLPSLDVEDAINDSDAIVFVEWASFIEDILPNDRIELEWTHSHENQRTVTIKKEGSLDVKKLLND